MGRASALLFSGLMLIPLWPGLRDVQASIRTLIAMESRTAPRENGAILRVPDSAFAPGNIDATYSGVADNQVADRSRLRHAHSVGYEQLGRLTGYKQQATWLPSQYEQVDFLYLGSIFATASQADRAASDGYTTAVQHPAGLSSSPGQCPAVLTVRCRRVLTLRLDGATRDILDIFTVKNCLVETDTDYPDVPPSQWVGQIQQTVARIDQAALHAAAACRPRQVGVAFERFRTLTLRGRPQTHFRVGQPFLLDMVWTVQNLSGTAFADRTFSYQLWNGAHWRTLQVIPDRIVIGNGTIPYQKQAQFFEPGTYRIVVRIRVGSATASKGVMVHVAQ